MSIRVVTVAERPFTDEDWQEVVRPAWPEFLFHESVINEHWWRLDEEFSLYQLLLVDPDDRVVAVGNAVPFAWNGSAHGLPDGIRGVLPVAVDGYRAGRPPTTLCALQAVVRPECRRQGLSTVVLEAMTALARAHELDCLVAPVRPTLKDRYPLQPIESYMGWSRPDGEISASPSGRWWSKTR